MTVSHSILAKVGRKAIILLFALALSLLAAVPAWAIDCVADAGGIIDGFVNYPVPPAHISIDGDCIIRNYPASNPMTSNFSFEDTLRGLLVVFDNVVFTGNMSCNASHDHKLWFVNSSSTTVQDYRLNLLNPVEKIDKRNPAPPLATKRGHQ